MAVEIHAYTRPVEASGHLLDVRRFAGAVIAGDDDATIVREAGEDGERRRFIEPIVRIDIRNMLISFRIGRHLHVAIETEELTDRHLHIGKAGDLLCWGGHWSSVISEATETRFRSTKCDAEPPANLAESRWAPKGAMRSTESLMISGKYPAL